MNFVYSLELWKWKDILLFHCFESVVSVAYQVCRFCFYLVLGVRYS
jgi:hypothetical protein